jgi:hypothetical protein
MNARYRASCSAALTRLLYISISAFSRFALSLELAIRDENKDSCQLAQVLDVVAERNSTRARTLGMTNLRVG